MRRREFLGALSGAMAWPLAARAQQPDRMRRIGVLMSLMEHDPGAMGEVSALADGLRILGWTNGGNVEMIYRWPGGDTERARAFAKEVIALHPDVMVARSTPATRALMDETHTIPIVFVQVADPVASGIVDSLARPGGNVTGFTNVEPSVGGKWLALLKDLAPSVTRAAILFNPDTAPYYPEFLKAITTAGHALSINVISAPVKDTAAIDAAVTALAGQPGGGLVVIPDTFVLQYRDQVIALAAKYRLPAIYSTIDYSRSGALLCYGVDTRDLFRRAAAYVDRILKGAKAADLPVQQPVKFDLVVNVKMAKALGINIPQSMLVSADELIE